MMHGPINISLFKHSTPLHLAQVMLEKLMSNMGNDDDDDDSNITATVAVK